MLSIFRGFLNTWAARAFFIVLVAAFALWGVADVIRNLGHDNALATVGNRKIEVPEFQEAYRQQLAQVTRQLGGRSDPGPAIRRAVAEQTLERLVVQAALADEVQRLGIAVPDAELRQAVFAIPAFQGRNGSFDRATFEAALRNGNFTEGRFLEVMRADLASRQLLETVQAGIAPPEELVKQVFAFQNEARVAEYVELPFSAAPTPPAPTEEDLRRTYENHPDAYRTPEYRRIKAVILSPDVLVRDVAVSDDEIRAYYDAHKSDYVTPEKRSAQVLVAPDEAAARALAAQWQGGADWAAMQKAASDGGGSAVELADALKTDIPSAELADAVFAATPDRVTGPVKAAFGYQVFRVGKITAGNDRSLDQVKTEIHDKLAFDRAVDLVYARASKFEDALSASTNLDDMPGDLGLVGLTGTLDAQGTTQSGQPAPIPGPPLLRNALVKAAFATPKGEAPHMIEGPGQSYYALAVDEVTPPALRPFEQVKAQVQDEWERDQRRREQETVAAKLLSAVKAGGSLDDAATVAGLRVETAPPVSRAAQNPAVPRPLVEPLFSLKQGDGTMVEGPEGFYVARLQSVTVPDPAANPAGTAELRAALGRAMDQDYEIVFASALRDRERPTVNRQLLDSFAE